MFGIDKEKDIVQYSTVHVQYSTVADGKILKRDAIHIVHGRSSVTPVRLNLLPTSGPRMRRIEKRVDLSLTQHFINGGGSGSTPGFIWRKDPEILVAYVDVERDVSEEGVSAKETDEAIEIGLTFHKLHFCYEHLGGHRYVGGVEPPLSSIAEGIRRIEFSLKVGAGVGHLNSGVFDDVGTRCGDDLGLHEGLPQSIDVR